MIENIEDIDQIVKALKLEPGTDYLLVFDKHAIPTSVAAWIPGRLEKAHGVKVTVLLVSEAVEVQMFDLRKATN